MNMEKRLFLAVDFHFWLFSYFRGFWHLKVPKFLRRSILLIIRLLFLNPPRKFQRLIQSGTTGASASVVNKEPLSFKEEIYSAHAGKFDFEISNVGGSITNVHLKDYNYNFH